MKNIKGFKVAAALCTVLVTASCSTSPKGDGTLTFVETRCRQYLDGLPF